jgi:hypothetical protein
MTLHATEIVLGKTIKKLLYLYERDEVKVVKQFLHNNLDYGIKSQGVLNYN